ATVPARRPNREQAADAVHGVRKPHDGTGVRKRGSEVARAKGAAIGGGGFGPGTGMRLRDVLDDTG
ncbi:MAG: hypothetical protein OXJ64_08740, partial [Boseongicola sp.]|nr:hypothetical protein [Boseongicola sp.]